MAGSLGSATTLLVFFFAVASALSSWVGAEPTQDKQALLAFLRQTPHASRVQWNASGPACDWVGVTCDGTNSSVLELRLPAVGLVGPVPPGTIGKLSQLQVLSLRSNGLSGPVPSDFSNLTLLRSLYLQDNNFSGDFPRSLTQLARLIRLDLSSNNFSGQIPFAVNNLNRLTGLFLQNNQFSGSLPSISAGGLTDFNVSNNHLNGSIPSSLSKFGASSFAGNLDLCGGPLQPCTPFFPSPAPSPNLPSPTPIAKKSKKKLSTAAIVAIAVGSALIAFLILLVLVLWLRRRRRQQSPKPPKHAGVAVPARPVSAEAGTSSSKDDITGGSVEAERNKLVFLEGGVYSFDLEDLLRASAEVLGKGSVGTSYKAVLEEGTTVVVKRLKDVVASKKEFEAQMEVLGKVKHENVVPLRAFYYSKDEKLLVYDYMAAGSLSALLHGNALLLLFLFLSILVLN